jgi:hypothetical protein
MEGAIQLALELDSHTILVTTDGKKGVMLLGEVTVTQCEEHCYTRSLQVVPIVSPDGSVSSGLSVISLLKIFDSEMLLASPPPLYYENEEYSPCAWHISHTGA